MNDVNFDELIFLWREYACEQDKRLTQDGIKLKQKVLDFVVSLPSLPDDLQNDNTKLCHCGCNKLVPNKKSEVASK